MTEANPGLSPEKLYGAEIGLGQDAKRIGWSLTGFVSKLDAAITNVTLGRGPASFPVAGFVPAGALYKMRENAGAVNAAGLEGEAHWTISAPFTLTAAVAYTHSRIDGGNQAPQLTGLKPALTAPLTVTAGGTWRALRDLTLTADLRYETARYDDDLNTLRLAAATTVNASVEWRVRGRMSLYIAADNLFDASVVTAEAADHTFSYDLPRLVRVGLKFRP